MIAGILLILIFATPLAAIIAAWHLIRLHLRNRQDARPPQSDVSAVEQKARAWYSHPKNLLSYTQCVKRALREVRKK
jgi:hypothetical protein